MPDFFQKLADRVGRLNNGTRDRQVRRNWHLSAVIDDYERLIEDYGVATANAFLAGKIETDPDPDIKALVPVGGDYRKALALIDPVIEALAKRGKLSPAALEKIQMHQDAISAEEEAAMILRNTERETKLEPTITEKRVEVKEGEIKRYEVEFREPERPKLEDEPKE